MDGQRTDIETSVEGADEIQPGRIDESDVVAAVDASPFDQSAGDAFSFLVELGARQRSVGCSFRSHQREQDVVGRSHRSPLKDFRYIAELEK